MTQPARTTPTGPLSPGRPAVEDHLPLADRLARQFAHRGIEVDDLIQVARLGLVVAVQRYRSGLGVSFEAFAVPTIRGELKRHFRDHGWAVRPPRRIQELCALVRTARVQWEQRRGHAPNGVELAGELGVEPREVAECATAGTGFTPLSLDARASADEPTLGERLGGDSPELERLADVLTLRRELGRLTPAERRIVAWRFIDGLSQRQIGELVGVSQTQVARILSGVLARLRSAFDLAGPRSGTAA